MNWEFLNKHRVRSGHYASAASDGFNGMFEFALNGEARRIRCIASDSLNWQHVSVSFGPQSTKTPSWEIMSRIKDLFWPEDQAVIQIHPAKSEHVNYHEGCLHLWRYTGGEMPLPGWVMVGSKEAKGKVWT